jgi:uroporphyrinogen-III synthase
LADSSKAPLAGKRIVITRAAEQSRELARMLEDRGAEVVLFPLVEFLPPMDFVTLDEQLLRLQAFDAVLFLSANAVRYVFERSRYLHVDWGRCRPQLIAAVGPATARALSEEGVHVDYVARQHTGEALARELHASIAGRSVLLPRSDRGNEGVSTALKQIGACPSEVVAYRTAMPEEVNAAIAGRISRGEVDAMIFASPSAVQNFAALLGPDSVAKLAQQIEFAAIGPTTTEALREAGLRVAMEAAESSAEGLADAIERFYEGQGATVS